MPIVSVRWALRLFLSDLCGHNQASYNCKFSDIIYNLNDVRRWVRPIAGKISAQTSLFFIFFKNLHVNAETMEECTSKI